MKSGYWSAALWAAMVAASLPTPQAGQVFKTATRVVPIPATMQAIADELHHQYVLGFSPEKLDDKLRRLDVKVRGSGFTVRARRTYFAGKADAR